MPDSATGEERTEPATPRKREKSREEGQVAQSKEVASVVVLAGGLAGICFLGPYMVDHLKAYTVAILDQVSGFPISGNEEAQSTIVFTIYHLGIMALPIIILIGIVSVLGSVLQFGLVMSPKALLPKGERIDPIQGAKRIFGTRGAVEVLKAILKMVVLSYICYSVIRSEAPSLGNLTELSSADVGAFLMRMTLRMAVRCILVLLALALLDYLFQRHQHEESIKMTRTELKQEMKQSEGDPLIKARIRQIARERARRRMMQAVPKADVVITNPTHYAVALKYDGATMPAPTVVAKGMNLIALKIREIAVEADVPIVQDPLLARSLYADAEIGDIVPENLYQAVAEVLAYVYELEHRLGTQRSRLQPVRRTVQGVEGGV
jgi:flagellar biosynthetic protein FlhB